MEIKSLRFGSLEVDESSFIHFPWGLPGFEGLKRYALLRHEDGPFFWLHAIDDPGVAFVVCAPEIQGFTFRVPGEKLAPISVESEEDLMVMIMVSFNRTDKAMRPHLRGPLLFNTSSHVGYQWIMDNNDMEKYISSLTPPLAAQG